MRDNLNSAAKAKAAFCLAVLAVCSTMIFAGCKLPDEAQTNIPMTPPPKKTDPTIQAPAPPVGLGHTELIAFDVAVEQDHEDPGIVHLTAWPLVDRSILAEYQDGILLIEIHVPTGMKLVKGLFRQRVSLQNLGRQKMEVDLRVINLGKLNIEVRGVLSSPDGKQLIYGQTDYLIISKSGGELDLSANKK